MKVTHLFLSIFADSTDNATGHGFLAFCPDQCSSLQQWGCCCAQPAPPPWQWHTSGAGRSILCKKTVVVHCVCRIRVQQSHKYMLLNLRSMLFHQSPEILVFFNILAPFYRCFLRERICCQKGCLGFKQNRFSKGWILEQPLICNFGSSRQQW